MNQENNKTSTNTKTISKSEASDVEGCSSFFESQATTSNKSRTKAKASNMRTECLKRAIESPLKDLTNKKPKTSFDDSLFVKEADLTDNADNFLSISQMNEFVVNDPFAEANPISVKSHQANTDPLDEFQFTQYCDNSQFMNQIETAISKIKQMHKSQQTLKDITNSPQPKDNAEMLNLTFNETLLGVFQSAQYKKELEESFNCVEKSICAMGDAELERNVNQSFTELVAKRKSQEKMEQMLEKSFKSPEVLKKVLEHASLSVNLNKEQIEWTDDSFIPPDMINFSKPSAIEQMLRNALIENTNKTLTQNGLHNATLRENKEQDEDTFVSHGSFFGLPERVRDLFKVYKGINQLYDWQYECLNLPAIAKRENLIYALPTSGGKTLVAEILILREILCRKKNALFILPYVAIVQEKVWAMSPFAVALEFLVEEYAAGKGNYPPRQRRRKNSVFICTIEKALGLMNSLIESNRTDEIGLVVVDELHLLGDGSRGATLETLLTKIKTLKNKIQMVGMSATIGNISELCAFLNAQVYAKDFRPVELVEYVKVKNEIAKINKQATDAEDILIYQKTVDYYKDAKDLDKIDPDHLGGLVMDVIPDDSCLIFCKTRQNCENVANLLCKVINPDLKKHRAKEKHQLKTALKEDAGTLCNILSKTIDYGIAYHHSGLTFEERRLLEEAYRQGIITVICCTSTLAAGVNLPAQRVIIRNPYIGREFINLARYKQMVGRAGRAGFGEKGESITICTPVELPRIKDLLLAPMDLALSSMHENNCDGLQNFLLSCVSLKMADCKAALQHLAQNTLLAVQAERLGVDVKGLTWQAIRQLFKLGALRVKKVQDQQGEGHDVTSSIDCTLASPRPKIKISISSQTQLEVSELGSAAIKGGLDLNRAHVLYEDLLKAQSCLVLFTGLHLMYLVTPYSIAEQVNPRKPLYYSLYTKLNDKEIQTAKVLGFTDAVASKLLTNRKITEIPELVMNRFFVTLMLYDLWNEMSLYEVAQKYEVNRGLIQNLMTSAASFASNVYHFCGEFDEFWAFALLLKGMSDRLSHCCVKELIPLMKLPTVKQARAKQLFNAGYKTMQSVARAEPEKLMQELNFMSRKLANQLVAAAKMILLEKVENLREEAEDVLEGINFNI